MRRAGYWTIWLLAAIIVALVAATHATFALEFALAIVLGCLIAAFASPDATRRRQAAEGLLLAIVVGGGTFELTWLRTVWLASMGVVHSVAAVGAAVALDLAALFVLLFMQARVWRRVVQSTAAHWLAAITATVALTVVPLYAIGIIEIARLSGNARFSSDVIPSSLLVVLGAVLAFAVWAGVFRSDRSSDTARPRQAGSARTGSAVAAIVLFAAFWVLQAKTHPTGAGLSATVYQNYSVEIQLAKNSSTDFDVVQSGTKLVNGLVLPLPSPLHIQSVADGWMLREFSYKPPATSLGGTTASILVKNLPAGAFNAALLTYSPDDDVEPKRFNGFESVSWTLTRLDDGIDFTYTPYAWIPQPILGWLMVFAGQHTAAQVVLTLLGIIAGYVIVHYRDAPWDLLDKWTAKRHGATPPKAADS